MSGIMLGPSRARVWLVAAAALALDLLAQPATAQQPEPQQPEPAAAEPAAEQQQDAPEQPPDTATDKLIGELLTADEIAADDDLRWLYSDTEEYAPSGLVGKPIPAPGLPQQGEGSPRTWNPRWRKFSTANYILTGAALGVTAGSALIPPASSPWRAKNSFDESVRDAIGIEDYAAGQWGRDVSDVLLSVAVAYPLLVDSLVVTYWHRRSHRVAGQMALITTETLAISAAVHGVVAGFASRERPYGRNCGTSIDPDLDHCEEDRRFRAFFSGHTTLSFAAAGVACSHHARHDVFGDPLADGLACGTAFVTAGMVGAMRVVGDQHYATDVATGAAVGTLTGLGVPWLLHYGPLAAVEDDSEQAKFQWSIVPMPNGVGVGGKF